MIEIIDDILSKKKENEPIIPSDISKSNAIILGRYNHEKASPAQRAAWKRFQERYELNRVRRRAERHPLKDAAISQHYLPIKREMERRHDSQTHTSKLKLVLDSLEQRANENNDIWRSFKNPLFSED